MSYLILLAVFGLIVGAIAKSKGRSFGLWFIYGALLFLIAFIHVIVIKTQTGKKCPKCLSKVDEDAQVCKFCRYHFTDKDFKTVNLKKEKDQIHNNKMVIVLIIIGIIFY